MDKKDLRQFIRMQKGQFSTAQLEAFSLPIVKRLLAHPRIKQAQVILMYYSLDDEVNTHEVINELVAQGKTVLLPAVVDDTRMELREYHGKQDLESGFFHLMEPVGKVFTQYDNIDVAVVPGMAFDSRHNRLGRGKGYYDRFLSQIPTVYKIGICFDFQKLPGIPAEENDIKMNEVL
jgi:5-formyltetrahydrofolate cyclo-ligase